jgi:hypothetical protein
MSSSPKLTRIPEKLKHLAPQDKVVSDRAAWFAKFAQLREERARKEAQEQLLAKEWGGAA